MAFLTAVDAIGRGDVARLKAVLHGCPDVVDLADTYDEVMEDSGDGDDGASGIIAMAPVVGTLLCVAVKYGQQDSARALLEAGARATAVETVHWHNAPPESKSPLRSALWSGNRVLVDLLCQHGAVPDQALMEEACAQGLTGIVSALLRAHDAASAGIDDALRENLDVGELLACAIQAQHKDIVELLLEHGASPNAQPLAGRKTSPLHLAVRYNRPDIAKLLLSRGATIGQDSLDGESLLATTASVKAHLEDWVSAAAPGPERDWRVKLQEQHQELTKVLMDTGTLQDAPGTVSHVLELFREFDENGDGTLDRDELVHVLQVMDPNGWSEDRVDKLLEAADLNKDGKIQFEEFLQWVFGDDGSGKTLRRTKTR